MREHSAWAGANFPKEREGRASLGLAIYRANSGPIYDILDGQCPPSGYKIPPTWSGG
jgi:hypothetical protein